MSKIEAVVFDLDGVIIDTERIWIDSIRKYVRQNNINLDEEFLNRIVGFRVDDTINEIQKQLGDSYDAKKIDSEATIIMDNTIKSEGLVHKKGLDELLAFLKNSHIKIGLATSSYKPRMEFKLKAANISKDVFDFIITGDIVKKSKPDPQIYTLACEHLHVAPENALAIEDSPIGIQSAYAAGLKPIFIPDLAKMNDQIEGLVYRQFDSLDQVIDILK